MRLEKLSGLKLILFMLGLLLFLPGFELKITSTATAEGSIESVDRDFRFLVVNGTKFSLPPGARVMDEKGNAVDVKQLRPGLRVTVEGARAGDGFSTKGIVVTPPKKKP